ncbi:MAG: beta-lactamase family protein [Gemmatimonadaceae bacterium]|nr:beta-lactamase family protein [Gemmatimonadaceae bacterium]
MSSRVLAQVDAPIDPSGLHAAMERALREEKLVGAVWAVLTPGETVTGAAGLRDARRSEPLTSASKVQIGSVAKTLIATGVLRLVTEGRLSLDTTVASLLPGVTLHNPWGESHPLLLRHLLDHTSGLDDARLWQVFSLAAQPDAPLNASFGRDPSLLRVRSRPGARLSYSNMGYTLLGMVIEAVAGERYEAYLDAHLLRPLGMHASSFQFISQTGPQADAQLAMGHFENGVTQAVVASWLRPSGQFTTTAADMTRFARFLMSNGEIDRAAFVDQQLLRAMGRPSKTEAALAGLEAGYGLGLTRRDRHGVIGRCHVGTTVGYRANLCVFPEEQKAFFVSVNTDSETADYERFDALLIRALGVKPADPVTPTDPPERIAEWEGIYALSPNRTESFAYLDLALNFAIVRWEGARLHMKRFQAAATSLTPTGGMLFRSQDKITTSHVLLTSSDGRRLISDGLRTFEQVSRWRIVPLWANLAAGVSGLVYLVLAGVARVVRRRLKPSDPVFVPFVSAVALVLPLPFFLGQSFLRLGDLTLASALLALVTGVLPLAMALGLWRRVKRGMAGAGDVLDAAAVVAVLQWAVVLAYWGLLPLRLWV